MIFDLSYKDKKIGTVSVTKEGLYYKICCRCRLPKPALFRLQIDTAGKMQDLGICVPKEDLFGVDTSIPVRNIEQNTMRFVLVDKDFEQHKVMLDPQKPFMHLQDLAHACLDGDGVSIAFRDQSCE